MSKITELISKSEGVSFSYEVTPNINEDEIKKNDVKPLFYSITWHAQADFLKSFDASFAPLKLAVSLRDAGYNVLLHISCNFMKKDYLNELLKFLQDNNLCNLFIILGERYDASTSDFATSQEIITYIRNLTGNYFCIGVAGFVGDDEKLPKLKEKVENDVDFILTQACFESTMYENFIYKCKQFGIKIPILPGIFPYETESLLESFLNLCKIKVSKEVLEDLKNRPGIEFISKLIYDVTKSSETRHFHLFTLNKMQVASKLVERVSSMLKEK